MRNKNKKEPNFKGKEGKWFLVRCFECGGKIGQENYIPDVASGICAWCGYDINKKQSNIKVKNGRVI